MPRPTCKPLLDMTSAVLGIVRHRFQMCWVHTKTMTTAMVKLLWQLVQRQIMRYRIHNTMSQTITTVPVNLPVSIGIRGLLPDPTSAAIDADGFLQSGSKRIK